MSPDPAYVCLTEETLKNKITSLRKSQNLSQEDVAMSVNLSRNAYRSLEGGDTLLLNPMLGKIADAFGMSVEEVIFYDPSAAQKTTSASAENRALKRNVRELCRMLESVLTSSEAMESDRAERILTYLKKVSAEPGGPALEYLRKIDSLL